MEETAKKYKHFTAPPTLICM